MEDKARLTAVSTLNDIDERKAFSNIRLNQYFKKYDLEIKDRTFAAEILYGTIRWMMKIDHMIQKFSKVPIDKMTPWVRNSLRSAVYQIFFMDRVPDFAAVNQAVELVKAKDKRAVTFVNAVLRNILRNRGEFDNINVQDKIKQLSIQYSHPEWFIKKFVKLYGEEFVKNWMSSNNSPSELTIRVNTLKTTREDIAKQMESKGVSTALGMVPEALKLDGYGMIEKSEEYLEGLLTIQDESSMLAARVLSPEPGDKVLDMCSAPGGKATHMAQLMENKGEVIAFDIHEHKMKLINDNASRLGISIINARISDAAVFNPEYENYADKILIDAPCSGLGLMRKKPEIRWNVTDEDIKNLSIIQRKIIENSSRYLKSGGALVYSTCTVTQEENEQIINDFLKHHSEFVLENVLDKVPEALRNAVSKEGYVKLFPHICNTDGFFIARLRRK